MFSLRPIKVLALFAFLPLLACGDSADETLIENVSEGSLDIVDVANIKEHLEWLADDAREGRGAGEAGHEASAKYVGEFFAELGLVPAGEEGWYQQVPLASYKIDTESTSVIVHRDGEDRELVYREHYGMSGDKVRAETSVRAEVVYVGMGVHAPEFGYSDYAGVDVEGKIVAVFSGAPSTFEHYARAYYASGRTKSQEAVRRGAIGSIGLRSRRAQERTPWERYKQRTGKRRGMSWVNLSGEASSYFPELRGSVTISAATAEELFEGTPISFEDALDKMEADEIASVPLGFEISLARRSTHESLTSPNVIGMVHGTDPELADEYVLYSAHLDAVGIDPAPETDDNINNGAYDNAIGVSIMLETARYFAVNPPARSVLFIALTAEEKGLLGSDYFAHYPTVPSDSIVANINLDMPMFLYPVADVVAFGSEHSSLESVVAEAANEEGFVLTPNPMPEENLFVRSDQYSFVRRGIPAIYLVTGFNATNPDIDGAALQREYTKSYYHKPGDDLSHTFESDSIERFTRAHIKMGEIIASDPQRPTWNDGDFFGERFAR
jgi:peptidase M28-like protein